MELQKGLRFADVPQVKSMTVVEHLEATAFLAALVASSDDPIIGKSLDGTVLLWNGAAERLYGYKADEIIGARYLGPDPCGPARRIRVADGPGPHRRVRAPSGDPAPAQRRSHCRRVHYRFACLRS